MASTQGIKLSMEKDLQSEADILAASTGSPTGLDLQSEVGGERKLRHGTVLEMNGRKCMVVELDSTERVVPLCGATCGTCSAVVPDLDSDAIRDTPEKYFIDGRLVCEKCVSFFGTPNFEPKNFVCISPLCRRKWKQLTSKVMPLFCPSCKKQIEESLRRRSRFSEIDFLEQMYLHWFEIFGELADVLGYPKPKPRSQKPLSLCGRQLPSGDGTSSTTATFTSPTASPVAQPPATPSSLTAEARKQWLDVLKSFEESFPAPPRIEDVRNWNSVRGRRKHYRGVVSSRGKFLTHLEALEEIVEETDQRRRVPTGTRDFPLLNLDDSLHEGQEVYFIAFPNPAVGERHFVGRIVKLIDPPAARRASSPSVRSAVSPKGPQDWGTVRQVRPASSPAGGGSKSGGVPATSPPGLVATPPAGYRLSPPGLEPAVSPHHIMTPKSLPATSPPGLEHLAPGLQFERRKTNPLPRMASQEEIDASRSPFQQPPQSRATRSSPTLRAAAGPRSPWSTCATPLGTLGESEVAFGTSSMAFGDLMEWSQDPEEFAEEQAATTEAVCEEAPKGTPCSHCGGSGQAPCGSQAAANNAPDKRLIRLEVALSGVREEQPQHFDLATPKCAAEDDADAGSADAREDPGPLPSDLHPQMQYQAPGSTAQVPAQPKRMPPGLRRNVPPTLRSPTYGSAGRSPFGTTQRSPGFVPQSPFAAYFGD